ncbi:formimidoylglutamate deiminase [Undibacterium fentianense]|uniref:Formimidoylglutamate deiminase n=1 Tax=Undibacterium fentianense TaxID=2828728 RepID=A0A941DZP4_9BURK|nr:formimidoylglutamate deiminase [Undibacterium fentianense]MBR7799765.1 formimidoylglutamate deiminase [Undibacterium fentianense]
MSTNTLFAKNALLSTGWASNVRLHWNQVGDFTEIEFNAQASPFEKQVGFVSPGMSNLHSHAFQRAMAGMTEIAGEGPDSFWTWRDLMYRFALAITPEQMRVIAAQLYMECLRHGYTSICEFHYVHRDPKGEWFEDRAETSQRVIDAARHTGIGMTMLPVLYSYADFQLQPLREDQRRFNTSVDEILRIVERLESQRDAQVEVGVAPHSLRAASTQQIAELVAALPKDRPIHIHIAEQMREVNACIAATGRRPVELLFDTQSVDQRWCLVHATHLNESEIAAMAASQSVAGICTSTEGNLGDGFFELPAYIAAQGRFGIGTDSHVSQSVIEEIRWLEYGQRLRSQGRNIASIQGQRRVADYLWQQCLAGGAQATGRAVGSLEKGKRADFMVFDDTHPNLQDLSAPEVLSTVVFAGNDPMIRDVYVGGNLLVENGRHHDQERIQQEYRTCMRQLRSLS